MPAALITGASKGIGKSIAEEFAKRKFDVLLIARSNDLLQEIASTLSSKYGTKADWLAIDLTDRSASQKIFDWAMQKQPDLNTLVNNVGYGLSGLFEKYSLDDHLGVMQVNMNIAVELCYKFLPVLKKQEKGYILNIASQAAFQAVPGLNIYAASKAFMRSFSRGLRYELRKTNVSVTVVFPGGTETDFANRAMVGPKALKAGKTFNMSPETVAKIAVKAMFSRRSETTAGFMNKLGKFLVWILPKRLSEKTAAGIYEV